ncbi:transcription repressor NadR [Olsenella massiliensis]|uniref:transcription repressor NadR n=1 Tax=Olsenella massiliensis TaxID=1622075 RepID=UPI00071E6430|nr:transcription repressor NadR [Olsenella massiliensis]
MRGQPAGERRRERLLTLLGASRSALTGAQLACQLGVSRQVIVQDIALIKAQGAKVVPTSRGYLLEREPPARPVRLLKLRHGLDRVELELKIIVDLGGTVEDTLVNHRTYGRLSAPLHVSSRSDVARFLDDLAGSRSSLLSEVTSGYHFHHVSARDQETLERIERALDEAGLLCEPTDWERAELS